LKAFLTSDLSVNGNGTLTPVDPATIKAPAVLNVAG
jgi:hypothetical protein